MTTQDVEQVEQQGLVLVQQAEEITVLDTASFQEAGGFLRQIATYLKRVGEVFDPIVDAAHRAHKIAVEQRKKMLEPAQVAERIVKGQMAVYEQTERERVAREQRERDAERRRLEDEARLAVAASLEAQGKPEAAQAALTAPVTMPVFTPPVQAVPKAEGVSFRDQWKARVVDPVALIKAVANGEAPANLVIADQQALNKLAVALKGEMRVPGVESFCDRISSVKA